MTEFACPSCGAPVFFQSNLSIFAVCPFCRSMLVRHDLDVELIGKMAVLPDDKTTPLQIGTGGWYQKIHFGLAGRIKLSWSDGSWDEWYAVFSDGHHGWLAQAQGFYMVSFQSPSTTEAPSLESLREEVKIKINGKTYEVEDIKETLCVACEGELPFKAPKGRKGTSVDCSGDDKEFACLEYSEDGARVFEGHYLEFDELKFSYLKQIDGW